MMDWKAENEALDRIRSARWMAMTDEEWAAELRAREIILSAHPEFEPNMRRQDERREELSAEPPAPPPPPPRRRRYVNPDPASEAEEAALDEHVWRVLASWIWKGEWSNEQPVAHAITEDGRALCRTSSRSGWAAPILTQDSRRCRACSRVILSSILQVASELVDEYLEPVFYEPVDIHHETISLLQDFHPHGWPDS
jgi:hypothetical protein